MKTYPAFMRLIIVTASAACALEVLLWACGPDFPMEVTSGRRIALLGAPDSEFYREAKLLVQKPASALPVVESPSDDNETLAAEAVGLPAGAVEKLKAMRAAEDGDAAYALGDGLSQAVRHYTAGAVSFRHGQLDQARGHFEGILALANAERATRDVWARFMLGRMAAARGNVSDAHAQFDSIRSLVQQGAPDPLGLAVASFGEEARLHLKPGALGRAVELYARQAAYGSRNGVGSLLGVARRIIGDDAWLDEGIHDDLTRRLVLLYLYTRGHIDEAVIDPDVAPPTPELADQPDAVREVMKAAPLTRVVSAIERHNVTDAAGAGWLAAAAYAEGRFDLAQRLVNRERSPIASWVKAKLSLRRGDTTAALSAYADALKAFPATDPPRKEFGRVRAEVGLVNLGRGEYAQALQFFLEAAETVWDHVNARTDYWDDVAYLAERVLTLEELKQFVDRHITAPSRAEMEQALENAREIPAADLRAILARRLMRAGRYAEARTYFDDERVRSVAEEYIESLRIANSRWRGRVSRAEAWFAAATVARFDGMELLGFELEPDFAVWSGAYDRSGSDDVITDDAPPKGEPVPVGSVVTADERKRVESSRPKPAVRFQYRLTAVDHAMRAADLLPRSSQAFAATLCKANGWIADREPEPAQKVYERYLREGPHVSWARHFGRRCPQPDFASARSLPGAAQVARVNRVARRHWAISGAVALLFAAMFTWTCRGLLARLRSLRPLFRS